MYLLPWTATRATINGRFSLLGIMGLLGTGSSRDHQRFGVGWINCDALEVVVSQSIIRSITRRAKGK